MNAINAIHPYKWNGLWVFDDESKGLDKEPFVSGADNIIDKVIELHQVNDADEGFTLLFSEKPFPGYQVTLERWLEDKGGNWYYCPELVMQGWLCPALFKYFDVAPELIFAEFRSIKKVN